MKTTAILSIMIVICISIVVAALTASADSATVIDDKAIAEHWAAVRYHKKFITNPANFERDSSTGMMVASPPDPLPSLAALVAAGELKHADLVLPTVPKSGEATRFWMRWAERQDEVWHMTGNPQYTAFTPSGDQPLHLNIWFERTAEQKIQQLIQDLEAMHGGGQQELSSAEQPEAEQGREESRPTVPEHPLLERFVGHWKTNGETVLVIETESDGDKVIRSTVEAPWMSVINNVRWEDQTLCYDEYMYYIGQGDFTTISNPNGEHPYSGVRNEVTLSITSDPNRIHQTLKTKDLAEALTDELTRASEE